MAHKTPKEGSQATLKVNVVVETKDGLNESSYVKVSSCHQDGLTLRGSVKMTHHNQEEFEKWPNGDHGQARRPRRPRRIISHKEGGRANMNDQMDSQGQMEVVGHESMMVRSLGQRAVGWLKFLGQTSDCPRNACTTVKFLGQDMVRKDGHDQEVVNGMVSHNQGQREPACTRNEVQRLVGSLGHYMSGWCRFLGQTSVWPRNSCTAEAFLGQTKVVRIGDLGWTAGRTAVRTAGRTADGCLDQAKIEPLEFKLIREFSLRCYKKNDHMGSSKDQPKHGPHGNVFKETRHGPRVQKGKWRGQPRKRRMSRLKRTYQGREGPHQVTCGPNHKRKKNLSHLESHVFVYTNSAKCQRMTELKGTAQCITKPHVG